MSVFKNDKYRRVRGGYTRLLKITCQECGAVVCSYQKDGPGNLRRMYLNRVVDPRVSLGSKALLCPKGHLLGTRIIYKKENRPAFRLFVDSVIKKISKAD